MKTIIQEYQLRSGKIVRNNSRGVTAQEINKIKSAINSNDFEFIKKALLFSTPDGATSTILTNVQGDLLFTVSKGFNHILFKELVFAYWKPSWNIHERVNIEYRRQDYFM